MSKYSVEFKVKLVKEYLDGKSGSSNIIAQNHNIHDSTLENCINWYEASGVEGLNKKLSNKTYTGEFKLSVIQYRKINETSLRETADKFCLTNAFMISSCEKAYRERDLHGLNSRKGLPPKDMDKNKTTVNKPLN